MRPQSDDFKCLAVFQNLKHQAMLYVDATRTYASQILHAWHIHAPIRPLHQE
jgi:hypothetical protein